MGNILVVERILNSRTAYYVSQLIERSIEDTVKKSSLIKAIGGKDSSYTGNETWKHITKMTFGELRYVIRWLWDNDYRSEARDIFKGLSLFQAHQMQRLDELVNLRNNIFHFTPLTIYLVYGSLNHDSGYAVRKTVIESMFFQNPVASPKSIKNDMTHIFKTAKRFISVKKT